jgi:hypothetical protein
MARLRTKLIQFWVNARDKKLYDKTAKEHDLALSQWIRRELMNATKRNGESKQ